MPIFLALCRTQIDYSTGPVSPLPAYGGGLISSMAPCHGSRGGEKGMHQRQGADRPPAQFQLRLTVFMLPCYPE